MQSKYTNENESSRTRNSTNRNTPSANLIIPDIQLRLSEPNPFSLMDESNVTSRKTKSNPKKTSQQPTVSRKKSVKIKQPKEEHHKTKGIVTDMFQKIKSSSSFIYHDKRVVDKYSEPEIAKKKAKSKKKSKTTCRIS
jgi:hypothetical protein